MYSANDQPARREKFVAHVIDGNGRIIKTVEAMTNRDGKAVVHFETNQNTAMKFKVSETYLTNL